jgi:ABC-type antimicrobial peptide transport system permease subunit
VSAVGMRARADLRRRLASVLILTLATGIVGAVAITAFTSAWRSDTAYARYRAEVREPEVLTAGCRNGFFPPLDVDAASQLPAVAYADRFMFINPVGAYQADGRSALFGKTAKTDAFEGSLLAPQRPNQALPMKLIAGRFPETADEAAVSWGPGFTQAGVGDTITVKMFSHKVSYQDLFSGRKPFPGAFEKPVPLTVTGIVLTPNDLNGTDSTIVTTYAFYEAHQHTKFGCDAAAMHLTQGLAGIPAFGDQISQLEPNAFFFDMTQEAIIAARSTHLRSIITRLFGWLVVIAGLLVVGQALIRRTVLASTEDPILRALGMSRGQITCVALVTGAIVGFGGAAIAVAVSTAASPFTSYGITKMIDPIQGAHIDPAVTIVAVVAIVAVALLLTGVPAWRLASARGGIAGAAEPAEPGRPSRVATALASIGMPVSAVAGARLALEPGHGRSATPVRSAVVGLSLTVAAMIAAFGFAASMHHFVTTPALWGVTGDFGTGSPFSGELFQQKAVPMLERNPAFSDITIGNFQNAVYVSNGGPVVSANAWGLTPTKGSPVVPTMLAGRWPTSDNEIALGATTLDQIGASIGDRIPVSAGGKTYDLTIVGEPVFPDFGFGPGFGQGAGLTFESLQRYYPDVSVALALGRFTSGVDQEAVAEQINPALRQLHAGFQPGKLGDLGDSTKEAQRSQNVPLALASLFTLSALATLIHVLITSVRRRRKDLAILRTLGFKKRQVASAVAWQSVVLAVVALLIGVPTGVLIGRLGWSLFATNLGVVSVPVIAWVPVVAAIPVTVVVAVLISIGPALAARRTKPAMVLRAE